MINMSIKIDEEEKRLLQELAKEEGTTASQLVRKAIKEYLKKLEK